MIFRMLHLSLRTNSLAQGSEAVHMHQCYPELLLLNQHEWIPVNIDLGLEITAACFFDPNLNILNHKKLKTTLTSSTQQVQLWLDSASVPQWSQGLCHHRYGTRHGVGWPRRYHLNSHLTWTGPGPQAKDGRASSEHSPTPWWWPGLSPAPHLTVSGGIQGFILRSF